MAAKVAPFIRFSNGYTIDKDTGCWLWNGHKYSNGYGVIKVFGKDNLVHRFAYNLYHGDIPDGLEILHSCDVKNCVNPDHLRAGTHQENMKEAKDRGRMRSGKDHPFYGKKQKKPRQSNVVRVLGRVYESQNAAEKALGLGSGTVRYWILNKPEKAEVISKGELVA